MARPMRPAHFQANTTLVPRAVRWLLAAAAVAVIVAPATTVAATVDVVNLDGAGEGFNDPKSVPAVGGNPARTLGQQRLRAFQHAADIWGALIESDVEIRVAARFDPLSCGSSSAVLGMAGPSTVHADFAGAPRADTWYPAALANNLAGEDLNPAREEIDATFNSAIGTTCSFPRTWYYGLDGSPPNASIDFVTVVLHELGHGLGIITFVSPSSGKKLLGRDDAYMVHLEDHDTREHFPTMTDGERAAAATNTGDLHWTGASVVADGAGLLDGTGPSGHVEVYAPSSVQSGSSLSHFSTALAPNELMEPTFTEPLHDVGLARSLMTDIGWGSSSCGDGIVDVGEQCDDGNTFGGDCCSPACARSAAGTPCEDGNACTVGDFCNGSGVCVAGASASCDDGNPCTNDSCSPAGGCAHVANNNVCNDALACTTADRCVGGTCTGTWGAACGLGAFKLYSAKPAKGQDRFERRTVEVADSFEAKSTRILAPAFLASPATLGGLVSPVPEVALACYRATDEKSEPSFPGRVVRSTTALGVDTLVVRKVKNLCVPTAVAENVSPAPLAPHGVADFKCYAASRAPRSPKFVRRTLVVDDGFDTKRTVVVEPAAFCTPADRGDAGVTDPDSHLECFKIKDESGQGKLVSRHLLTDNAFGPPAITVHKSALLCVPASMADLGAP